MPLDWISLNTDDEGTPLFSPYTSPFVQVLRHTERCYIASLIPPDTAMQVPFYILAPAAIYACEVDVDWRGMIQYALQSFQEDSLTIIRTETKKIGQELRPAVLFWVHLRFSAYLLALRTKKTLGLSLALIIMAFPLIFMLS